MVSGVSALTTVALCGGELPSWFVILLLLAVAFAFILSIGSFLSTFISKFSESEKKEVSDDNDNIFND